MKVTLRLSLRLKYWIFDIVEILDDHCGVIPIHIRVHHLLAYKRSCPTLLCLGLPLDQFAFQSLAFRSGFLAEVPLKGSNPLDNQYL
jgi:hypothetical protein